MYINLDGLLIKFDFDRVASGAEHLPTIAGQEPHMVWGCQPVCWWKTWNTSGAIKCGFRRAPKRRHS